MAKAVKWTIDALQDRINIYNFWVDQIGSDRFSQLLDIASINTALLLAIFPEIGIRADTPALRFKVVRGYKIFYFIKDEVSIIARVWDSRQNPGNFTI